MQRPDYIPEDYDRIAVAGDETAFFKAELEGRVNCILLPRFLTGDFNALAKELYLYPSWLEQFYDEKKKTAIRNRLSDLAAGNKGIAAAAAQVMSDLDLLRRQRMSYDLRVIGSDYYHEPSIHALHMDVGHSEDQTGTFMCSYTAPTTAWARNDDCGKGLPVYALQGDTALIFNLNAGAHRNHFRPGDMIRQASQYNYNFVDGFIHAAERIRPGELRLLLVGRAPAP